jgi:hypothetical protein
LVTVYGKDERDDLSKAELELLCRLARALRKEAMVSLPPRRIG